MTNAKAGRGKKTVKKAGRNRMQRVEAGKTHVGEEFIAISRRLLVEEYLPKIKKCIGQLSDEDIWWRSHETDNSIGNLLLHLSGNIRQWIIKGIGGKPYQRNRPLEFAERSHIPGEELLKLFETTISEANEVLRKFDAAKLLETRHFQKWDCTCLYAISHVVEHVAQHMGQIIYVTKLRTSKDLKLVDV